MSNAIELHPKRFAPLQKVVIGVCILLNALDGFDLSSIAYVAPVFSQAWGTEPQVLGLVFTSGFIGMAIGSLAIAPWSDKLGRRLITVACSFDVAIAMLASAAAKDVFFLMALRFALGLGIGGMLPTITSYVSEYAPPKLRSFMIGVFLIGYPVGAMLGGLVSTLLIESFGWPSVFFFGGVVSLVSAVIALIYLPESFDFLSNKRPKGGFDAINEQLAKMRCAPLDDWPTPQTEDKEAPLAEIFSGPYKIWTPLLATAFFMAIAGMYFVVSWLPKILVNEGLSLNKAIYVTVLNNAGGLVGVLSFGWLPKALACGF